MHDCLKIGIIGCGNWGPGHARIFDELDGAQLAWLCDLSEARLEHLQGLYPRAHTTREARQLLASDVDAVVIATPAGTHHRLGLESLRAGKHVLVEKPLALSAGQAAEIAAEARLQGRVAMVGHTFVYNPAVEAVQALIASGDLGHIHYIDATRANLGILQPDISVLWDLAPHDVSILRFILGMDPVRVRAYGRGYMRPHTRLHDVAYLSLLFSNGAEANLRLSWLYPCKVRQYVVVGSRQMLVYDDIAADKVVTYDSGVEMAPCPELVRGPRRGEAAGLDAVGEWRLRYRHGEAVAHPIAWAEPLQRECQHFVQCIREGREPRSSAREGLKVVQVLEAAQRSLEGSQGWEVIP